MRPSSASDFNHEWCADPRNLIQHWEQERRQSKDDEGTAVSIDLKGNVIAGVRLAGLIAEPRF